MPARYCVRTHAPRLPTPEHRGRRPDKHSRGRTSPRGPNEGLLRRSFPDNLPQKRLKAPAADDPHRIISNQDLNSHKLNAGGDLLSHTLPGAVPSAQAGLASGFGKGPGVTPPLKPPTNTTEQTTHTPNQPHRGHWCAVSFQTLHNEREYLTTRHTHHQNKQTLV